MEETIAGQYSVRSALKGAVLSHPEDIADSHAKRQNAKVSL